MGCFFSSYDDVRCPGQFPVASLSLLHKSAGTPKIPLSCKKGEIDDKITGSKLRINGNAAGMLELDGYIVQ